MSIQEKVYSICLCVFVVTLNTLLVYFAVCSESRFVIAASVMLIFGEFVYYLSWCAQEDSWTPWSE